MEKLDKNSNWMDEAARASLLYLHMPERRFEEAVFQITAIIKSYVPIEHLEALNMIDFSTQGWWFTGSCGNCGGPVISPLIWDETGTITGSKRPEYCAICRKEPKERGRFDWGPKREMN